MDAVKYLKEAARMCDSIKDCSNCPLNDVKATIPCKTSNASLEQESPEEAVAIVEKWSAEHSVKTRQSEFLKMFPNASIVDGVPELNPCHVDNKFSPQKGCGNSSCGECRKEYWSQEVDDDK